MTATFVVNASPLICFAKADALVLLERLAMEVVVPDPVVGVPAAVPVLRALRAAGIHLDDGTIRDALRRTTGESW